MTRATRITRLGALAALVASLACTGARIARRPEMHDVVALGAGADFTCALTRAGHVLCWGRNDVGQLGRGTSDTLAHPDARPVALRHRATQLSVGYDHACAIDDRGSAWCWGDDRMYEAGAASIPEHCGTGADAAPCRARPVRVFTNERFTLVAAGFRRSCGTMSDGTTACWGDSGEGDEPHDSTSFERCAPPDAAAWCSRAPTTVALQLEKPPPRPPVYPTLTTLSVGARETCGTTAENVLLCWSKGTFGRARIVGPRGLGVARTSIGYLHSCALREDLVVLCWGTRGLGALGMSTSDPNDYRKYDGFTTTRAIDGDRHYSTVSAGGLHSCAIEATSRAAYCWGANQYGQLGIGSADTIDASAIRASHPAPVAVAGGHQFAALAAGLEHTCGVSAEGDVWCWGRSRSGATGQVGTPFDATPVVVH